ncbi:MAG TPA: hypothetical protein DDW52_28095 [Planctomycetaceae bacterium]|nr:hypothetical protein [Planctomycetaceae bacterium]
MANPNLIERIREALEQAAQHRWPSGKGSAGTSWNGFVPDKSNAAPALDDVDLFHALAGWLETYRSFGEVTDPNKIYETLELNAISQGLVESQSNGAVAADPGRILLELVASANASLAVHMSRQFDDLLDQLLQISGHTRKKAQPSLVILKCEDAPKVVTTSDRIVKKSKDNPKSESSFLPVWDANLLKLGKFDATQHVNQKAMVVSWPIAWETTTDDTGTTTLNTGSRLLIYVRRRAKDDVLKNNEIAPQEQDRELKRFIEANSSIDIDQAAACLQIGLTLDADKYVTLSVDSGLEHAFNKQIVPVSWLVSESASVDQFLVAQPTGGIAKPTHLSWQAEPTLVTEQMFEDLWRRFEIHLDVIPCLNRETLRPGEEVVESPDHSALFPNPNWKSNGSAANCYHPKDKGCTSEWTSKSLGTIEALTLASGGRDAESDLEYFSRGPKALRHRGVPHSARDWEAAVRSLDPSGRIAKAHAREGYVFVADQEAWTLGTQIAFYCYGKPRQAATLASVFEEIAETSLEWIRPIGSHFQAMAPVLVPGRLELVVVPEETTNEAFVQLRKQLLNQLTLEHQRPAKHKPWSKPNPFWDFLLERFRSPVFRLRSMTDNIRDFLVSTEVQRTLVSETRFAGWEETESIHFIPNERVDETEPEYPYRQRWVVPFIERIEDIRFPNQEGSHV